MATVEVVGIGSHTLRVLADSSEAEVSIDGVLVHRVGSWFVKSIGVAMGLDNAGNLRLVGKAQTFNLDVSPRTVLRSSVRDTSVQHNHLVMRALGTSWREAVDGRDDIERLYDPRVPNPVQAAVTSLQKFGRHEVAREIRIVDPFILDIEALKGIAAIASGHEGFEKLDAMSSQFMGLVRAANAIAVTSGWCISTSWPLETSDTSGYYNMRLFKTLSWRLTLFAAIAYASVVGKRSLHCPEVKVVRIR